MNSAQLRSKIEKLRVRATEAEVREMAIEAGVPEAEVDLALVDFAEYLVRSYPDRDAMPNLPAFRGWWQGYAHACSVLATRR